VTATLHVYRNGATDWFVAESAEEAHAMGLELGALVGADEEYADEVYVQCADDSFLKIDSENGPGVEAKTCAEWAASSGKGFLCTENY